MLLLICSIIIGILTFFVYVYFKRKSYTPIFINILDFANLCTSIFMFIVILTIPCSKMFISYDKRTYLQQKEYIESLQYNTSITEAERMDALDDTISFNRIILDHRQHINSVWIGIYYSKDISDLEIIDLRLIPSVNNKIQINKE